jgi:hypothetical protein
MPRGTSISLEAASLLEGAIDTLRWCRLHPSDRLAAERLRELQVVLTVVALALDYEMDGQPDKAAQALERAGAAYETARLTDPTFEPSLFDEGH